METKFFEVCYPYYALIKASDEKEAYDKYVKFVAEDMEGNVLDSIKEVSKDYALAYYSMCVYKEYEENDEVDIQHLLNDFYNNEYVLLVSTELL